MAFSYKLVKNWYKDLSVKELEKKYKEIESNYRFDSKDSQIKYYLENFLNASHGTNTNSTRRGLEELLEEKTGKKYTIEEKYFEIDLADLINYISKNTKLLPKKNSLIEFFDKLTEVEESEKFEFLVYLVQSHQNFKDFVSEVNQASDESVYRSIFDKYLEIAEKYYSDNRRIG